MITIHNKRDCCGCASCVQACPRQCISFHEDEEGFLYPRVDESSCINCHLCEKVCPMLRENTPHEPLHVYAAVNPDETIRMQSSSGGIFTLLAESIIDKGGVIFGARFNDNWEVVHDYTESKEGLKAFRGSKYVQSRTLGTFKQVRDFLKKGRLVLFSGTPCQIAGLKLFLRKDFENLLTIEVVCHGVPSPGLWRQYLQEQSIALGQDFYFISNIIFKDKQASWKRYHCAISYEDGSTYRRFHGDFPWTRAFIHNLGLRPSCSKCPAKCYHSYSDITLGDLWGANQFVPDMDDDKGTSLVIVHSQKGDSLLVSKDLWQELPMEKALKHNRALAHPTSAHRRNLSFVKKARKCFIPTVLAFTRESWILRLKIGIHKLIHRQ